MAMTILEPALSFGQLAPLPRSAVRCVVVHTQGAPGNADGSVQGIHAYHRQPPAHGGRGWAGVGYHFVVRKHGAVERGRPLERQGAHVHGYNHASVGICCSGNGDLADFTPAQKQSLRALVEDLRVEFPGARVHGHRPLVDELVDRGELPNRFRTTKTCPGARVNTAELQQLIGLEPVVPRRGDRRWSRYFNDWVVLRSYSADDDWTFVPSASPRRQPLRAHVRWSEMPLAPA